MKLQHIDTVMDRIRQQYDRNKHSTQIASDDWGTNLEMLRCCFTLGSESESFVQQGQQLLRRLPANQRSRPEIRAFQAAFTALEAKYSMWPIEKFSKVNQALKQFDHLERQFPDLLEVQFLILAVTSRLPAVFNRRTHVRRQAQRVNSLLDRNSNESFSDTWTDYALDFLIRNGLRKTH